MAMKGCRRCTYWQGVGKELDRDDPIIMNQKVELGLCRRYAPRPGGTTDANGTDNGHDSLWPLVASDEWCGEWEPNIG